MPGIDYPINSAGLVGVTYKVAVFLFGFQLCPHPVFLVLAAPPRFQANHIPKGLYQLCVCGRLSTVSQLPALST